MSDAYQDKDIQAIEKDKGQIIASALQGLAMGIALLKKPKAKAIVKTPPQPKPKPLAQPPPKRPHAGVKDDLLYIEAQRNLGVDDQQIITGLQQRSTTLNTAQSRYENGDEYLKDVMELPKRVQNAKLPSAGVATKQTHQKNLGR